MSSDTSKRYALRGVSASKEDVHNAIKNIDKGLFPQAFCKIIPDYLTQDEDYCLIMHADGAGTKSSLAYMYWKETGDVSVWKGIAQDALIMNIDDLLCVGATDNILLSSTIGRNKNLIPGEVLSAIINGTEELIAELKTFGVTIHSTGGFVSALTSRCKPFDVWGPDMLELAELAAVAEQSQHYDEEYDAFGGCSTVTMSSRMCALRLASALPSQPCCGTQPRFNDAAERSNTSIGTNFHHLYQY